MPTYSSINSLEEISFIAGTDYTLEFKVYDQDGGAANISPYTITWKMSPYGRPGIETLSYNATITGANTFEVYLLSTDTMLLNGKFMHQPILTNGSISYRSQQGIIEIVPAIDDGNNIGFIIQN